MPYEPFCVENFVWFLVVLGLFLFYRDAERADAEINGSASPPLARMNPDKSPSPSPRGPSPQPETSKGSGVGSLLRIRKSRKVSAEQPDGSTSPPPISKKRFLRKPKKAKENAEEVTPSVSGASGASTPSITPSPSPKPKKSNKASALMRKLSIGRNRRRTSPANTDTSEDERRAGGVTPPAMMQPPLEEAVEGDQSQRASAAAGGVGGGTPGTLGETDDSVVKGDMKSEPDLGASEAEAGGAEGPAPQPAEPPPADAAPPKESSGVAETPELTPEADVAVAPAAPPDVGSNPPPKTPTRSQFLSITTPVVAAMQDGLKGEEAPFEHPLEASASASAVAVPEEAPAPQEAEAEAPPTDTTADLIASARHKLSQSLGSARNEPAAQYNGEKREHLYKILVIGELGTGKTSIIKRYVHQFFSQHYRATIGVDFALKVLNWDPATIVRLQLWDIAGQERFGNMTRVYYKEAVGAFIVFDVTRAATFDAVLKWKQDLDSKVQMADGSPIPCVLLANKCDQPKEGIVNTTNKIDDYCNEHGFTTWFETSAKDNVNIDEAARALVAKILQNDRLLHGGDVDRDPSRIALNNRKTSGEQPNGKSCFC